jgi:titin
VKRFAFLKIKIIKISFFNLQVAPKLVSQLKGTNVILEGQHAHFECRLEPQNDPSLKVEWLHNGRPLSASSRIQTHHDFGYVALDILDVKADDSGT